MISRAIKTLPRTFLALLILTVATVPGANAQTASPSDSASMVKPPRAPNPLDAPNAAGAHTYNPDNMPTKRPALPANSNRMLHNNPASDAIAK
jgi:hypothetical protein